MPTAASFKSVAETPREDGAATGSSSGPTTGPPSPARAASESQTFYDRCTRAEGKRHTRAVIALTRINDTAARDESCHVGRDRRLLGLFRPSGVSSAPPTLQPDAAPLVSTVVGATMPVMVPVTGPIAAAAPGVDLAPDYGCRQDGDLLQCSFLHCASFGSPRTLMYGAPRRWLRAAYGETVHLVAEAAGRQHGPLDVERRAAKLQGREVHALQVRPLRSAPFSLAPERLARARFAPPRYVPVRSQPASSASTRRTPRDPDP